ncbi:TIGR02328 family protein [Virgibacillus sp. W0430]|uniref:TIGR02328 family protein n=1 Tax=Virgibacillus sp. W0430 TaxID=3391580 RepID=UPI003F47F432
MRLWHEKLIPHLPRQQLLGQHRECCALRGNGWGKKHSVVNYVFTYPPIYLFQYHERIMKEMERRNYRVDPLWKNKFYRGKKCASFSSAQFYGCIEKEQTRQTLFYNEHDEAYLQACLVNLLEKGIDLYDTCESQ